MSTQPLDFIVDERCVPKHVFLIVVDAMKYDYLRRHQLPNIQALVAKGVSFENAIASNVKAETAPGFATISTGAYVKDHGISGSSDWYDRESKDLKYIFDETTGKLFMERPGIAEFIKSIEPSAKVAAISSKDRHALLLAGDGADVVAYSYREHTDREGHFSGSGMSSDNYVWVERVGHELPAYLKDMKVPRRVDWNGTGFNHSDVDTAMTPYIDEFIMDGALRILEQEQPKLLLIGLVGPNIVAHTLSTTSPEMDHSMAVVDQQIGRLVGQVKAMGWMDDSLFIVTADHGMAEKPNSIDLVAEFNSRGHKDLVDNIAHMYKGAAGGLYLHDSKQEVIDETVAALRKIEHVSGAWHQFDSKAPWFIRRGAHKRSPDIIVLPEFRYQILPLGASDLVHETTHGAPYFDDLSIALIFSGCGVNRLGTVGDNDIAPDALITDEQADTLPEQTQIRSTLQRILQV